MSKYLYDNNLAKMDLFLEGYVAHSYYMLLMIGLYHLTNIFLLIEFTLIFQKPHTRLLLKLEAYGITGKLLVWFRNFLMGRHQCVKVNGTLLS